MSRSLAAVLTLLVTCSLAAQETGTVIRAPEAGFELAIPDVGWVHQEMRSDGALNALVVGPEGSGGLLQLSVQVSTVTDGSLEAVRAQVTELRASIAGDATITDVEDLEIEVAGRAAHGIAVHQAAFGDVFRAYVVFFRARGFQYRIQFHAPRDQFEEQWRTADRVLGGFALIELDAAAVERVRLRALAARCGSQVAWAEGWEEASERARRDKRLVVVSIYAQPGFDLGNALNERVFMSPEVIALMEHRFVGVRWARGEPAPFVDHDVFGLGGSTFGAGLLVCTPDGRVVRQVFLLDPVLVSDALRAALLEYPDLAPPPACPPGTRAEEAAFLVDSGQLEAARKLLGEMPAEEPGVVTLQRARLHRVERSGDAALSALRAAHLAIDPVPSPDAMSLEEAVISIGMGRNDVAEGALRRCLDADPGDAARAQATLLLGALAWAGGDAGRAKETWTALTENLPDEPAAWVAAASLLGPALQLEILPDLGWPSEVTARMAHIPAPAASSSRLEIASGLSGAVDWLIEAQRADGGWDLPFGTGDTHPAPDPITMAAQAICTHALVRVAGEWERAQPNRAADCLDAARRGLRRYLKDRELGREHPRPVAFMDYTCWGSSYGLFLLNAILERPGALPGSSRAAIEAEAAHLVRDLVRIQSANGGWSYYLSGQVDGAAAGAAMSFTTATVLLALDAANDQGIDVPGEVLERGFDCLESMRGTNGVFEYMRGGAEMHAAGEVGEAGSTARGPVCTLALRRGGRLNAAAMVPAFERYVEHLGVFGAEARKALMHAGPSGEGSHYLLYDYSTAAGALRATGADALDTGTRRRARTAILRELARCRNADGSFVDNPILGCTPGTGLAAMTLLDLLQDPAARP